jgi:hypothetical protein
VGARLPATSTGALNLALDVADTPPRLRMRAELGTVNGTNAPGRQLAMWPRWKQYPVLVPLSAGGISTMATTRT